MRFRNPVLVAGLLAALSAGGVMAQDADSAAPPRTARAANSEWSDDGLQKVTLAGVDVAYIRPNAGVGTYKRYSLGPVEVAFRRDWERSANPRRTGRISDADQQRIRDRVAAAVREELIEELTAGNYVMADAPAADVIRIDVRIVDLYVVAPEQFNEPRAVYTQSAGEMTLVAELVDSNTGEVEARLFDHAEAPESISLHRVFHSENEAEGREIVGDWAKSLRLLFDAARTVAEQNQ